MHWHVRDGGVGKTTLAAHIHNQLQEKPHIFFFHVCWITMSQEFSIHASQDLIAEAFGLCLPKGKDVTSRAGELWTALSVIQNHVIILDDLWDDFHPEKLGISRRTNGCKLIVTISHSLKKIEVDPESLLNTVEHF